MAALSKRITSALHADGTEHQPEITGLFDQLPVFSRQQALRKDQIGAGWCYAFTVNDAQGYLWLLPEINSKKHPKTEIVESHWQCALGEFTLINGEAVLNLFSHSPLPPPGSSQWYWSLFNHYLSPQLALLFGELTPASTTETEATRLLRLQVDLAGQQAACQLRISEETLTYWLAQPGLQRRLNRISGTLPVSFPLNLASISLTPSQLTQLTSGAMLVPQQPFFTPTGEGCVVFADKQIQVEWRQPQSLLVTQVEKMCMSQSENEHEAMSATVFDPEGDIFAPELADLPLKLQLHCGQITLSLGELQQLAVGSLLSVTGLTPGYATLCHGEHKLAEGELVNIEGQLGLLIRRLYLSGRSSSDEGVV